ncbi:type II secretion system protein GspC [Haliangium ochraceum]|uniref:General secretion pathway protein C n=1 Tax=Haliangium ochraceum (strain DSM 14365 / JCM 11303 / SMP-2) TaxID=502025 RepID=D0LLW2_HALO1|nr:type II secretion system protein GspC [Haliangium ochraceum]ACY15140.1 general secretion pathway protein C [Haliangium ochraceum DSM 14365]
MQDLVKKYFWAVGVVVTLGAASLAASGTSHIVEGLLIGDPDQVPEVEPPPMPRSPMRSTRSKSGEMVASRNMFCSDCEPPTPEVTEPDAPTDPNAVPATSLPLELLATNLSNREQQSFATIRNTSNDSQGAYWMNQEIPGAGEIVRIAGIYVDFRNTTSNRVERISLLEQPPPAPARATPPPTRPRTEPRNRAAPTDELSAMLDAGIKKTGDNNYEVDRQLVDKVLANPMSVARGARIVPSVKNGEANGFKLYAIRPSSVYAKLGMRNGDTVTSVNGFDLSSPDKALEVYTKVRSASNLSVTVLRRGQPTTLNYNIR